MKQGPYVIRGLLGAIVIITIGVLLAESTEADRERSTSDSRIEATAILGGNSQRSFTSAFEAADVVAFMGGVSLDLREAGIVGDEAVVEVFAMFGGVEIRVPENWVVIQEVHPVLGGVENRARAVPGDDSKRLIVRGNLLFGGLDIRN
jgi:predicted membrane protein